MKAARATGRLPRAMVPMDSPEYARRMVEVLRSVWMQQQADLHRWTEELEDAREARIWIHLGLPSLDAVLKQELGLDEKSATAAVKLRAGPGRPKKGEGNDGDAINSPRGSGTPYTLARLERDHEELAALVRAAEGDGRHRA